jgi:phosphohistidine swiveling domain-containing protein
MTKAKINLADRFIKLTADQGLYPRVFNLSIFTPPLSAFIHSEYYSDASHAPYLVAMKQGQPAMVFIPENKLRNISQEVFEKYWQDPSFLASNNKHVNQLIDLLDELYQASNSSYIAKSKPETLVGLAEKILSANRRLNTRIWFSVHDFSKEFIHQITKKSGSNVSLSQINRIWQAASKPAFHSFDKRRYSYLLNLIINRSCWKEVGENCQYFFANYDRIADPLNTLEKLYLNTDHLSVKQMRKLINNLEKQAKQKRKEHESWFSALDKDEQKITNYLQEVIRLRDFRKDGVSKALTIFYRIAEKFFTQVGLDKSLIPYFSSYEVLKGLSYLARNKRKIAKRPEGVVMLWSMDNKFQVQFEYGTYDQTVRKLEKYHLSKQSLTGQDQFTIKGQVASKGKVRGIARIITDPTNDKGFQKGDILVTGMTRPEFVPLMKKAAGVVTNEGGITSHAAIISRELKKPCIVGTKVATTFLKDGDLIEVDAKAGVVRVLKGSE